TVRRLHHQEVRRRQRLRGPHDRVVGPADIAREGDRRPVGPQRQARRAEDVAGAGVPADHASCRREGFVDFDRLETPEARLGLVACVERERPFVPRVAPLRGVPRGLLLKEARVGQENWEEIA
ncbi:MAG: hypothetical protein ACK56I_26310, partial [bacterium]